jgi:iron complex transport system substrate-binding protein
MDSTTDCFPPDLFPQRIVCLTEETTETIYLLGEQERLVGISGFTVRPTQARKEKPKVSAFTEAKIDQIIALKPDLVIGFSDIQAQIAKELIAAGITVWINNHRSVAEIFKMMAQLGSLLGQPAKAHQLIQTIQHEIKAIQQRNAQYPIRPKVYFEEWFDPLITGIRWVSELIGLAGGDDIFGEKSQASLAKDRIIADHEEVVRRNPDLIIASWCGKKFKRDKLVGRKNWEQINAVKNNFVFEINSSIILQPGPAALTEGLKTIAGMIQHWHQTTHQRHGQTKDLP